MLGGSTRFPPFRWAATISPLKPRFPAAEKDRITVDADAAAHGGRALESDKDRMTSR